MTSPVDLTLLAEHRRGHGALYDALNCGRIDVDGLRRALAMLPQPKAADNRLVLAVDVITKLIKRQMYGCASFPLLRHRILLG